jgi:hypothetical protein
MEMSSQLHTLANLPSGKEASHQYRFDKRLVGVPELVWTHWTGEKNLLHLPGTEPPLPQPSSPGPAAILSYPSSTQVRLLCLPDVSVPE